MLNAGRVVSSELQLAKPVKRLEYIQRCQFSIQRNYTTLSTHLPIKEKKRIGR